MNTETQTTAPAATTTETTPAAAQTSAQEAPATPRNVFETGKAAAIAKVEAMRAEKAQQTQAGQKPGEQSGETAAQDAGQNAGDAAADGQTATTDAKEGEQTQQQAAAAEPSDEDKAAQALLDAAKENRALIEQRRRLSQRETELKEREAKLTTATVPEREAMARLTKARESGDPIEILRAAGYKDTDISDFALNLIDRMGKMDDEPAQKPAPKMATAEEVAALVLKQAEERAQELAKKQEAERSAEIEVQRNAYFQKIGAEFKVNAKSYPVLAAIQPTFGQLEARFLDHFNRTGERLAPQQLLATLEKEYAGRGLTFVAKKDPKPAPATATSRTIGATARTSTDTVTVHDDEKQEKTRDMYAVHEEGRKAAIAAIEAKRATKRARV